MIFDSEHLKNNSALAIPYIVNNRELATSSIIESTNLFKLGLYVYLTITYRPKTDAQKTWLNTNLSKESNINTIEDFYDGSYGLMATFIINRDLFTVSVLLINDFELVDKTIILNNVEYWGALAHKILSLYKKNPAARESSRV